MELSELILVVIRHSNAAVRDYTRGAIRTAAEDLAFIANEINKELPNIELPPAETFYVPGPADDTELEG